MKDMPRARTTLRKSGAVAESSDDGLAAAKHYESRDSSRSSMSSQHSELAKYNKKRNSFVPKSKNILGGNKPLFRN